MFLRLKFARKNICKERGSPPFVFKYVCQTHVGHVAVVSGQFGLEIVNVLANVIANIN